MNAVNVLSGGAAAAVVRAVQVQFESGSQVTIQAQFNAVGQIRDQLLAGAPCDLIILTRPLINQLMASGHVVAGSDRSLGLVRTGVAVRSGSAHPPIADAEQLAAAFRSAQAVFYPDPEKATAGIHFMNVLRALGLDESLRPTLRAFPNGATAMEAMAKSDLERVIGCTQETEINYTPGVDLVGSLPHAFELATDYVLGVCSGAQQPVLAAKLAELVAGAASAQVRRKGGFSF